jgi:hypothetical protein
MDIGSGVTHEPKGRVRIWNFVPYRELVRVARDPHVPNEPAYVLRLEFSWIFVVFENERSRFRPLNLWRTCGERLLARSRLKHDYLADRRSATAFAMVPFLTESMRSARPRAHSAHCLTSVKGISMCFGTGSGP